MNEYDDLMEQLIEREEDLAGLEADYDLLIRAAWALLDTMYDRLISPGVLGTAVANLRDELGKRDRP